jgi:chloramphenicol-sensitive protein RarD
VAERSQEAKGIIYGVLAFLTWGILPAYWRLLKGVPAHEILAHRVVWSALFVAGLLAWRGRGRELLAALRNPRVVRTFLASASLIGVNWLIFIWAVVNGHVLQASLGYFINPLVNVLIGAVVLKERLSRPQLIAVAFATAGVLNLALRADGVPWIALSLAGTFAAYGLIRKTAPIDSLVGLGLESALLAPLAFGVLVWMEWEGTAVFLHRDALTNFVLIFAGVVTALPLLWFAHAARRLTFATLGLLQYIAPTGQFLLAVVAYGEPFSDVHALSFGLIWTGLLLYSITARR